MWVEVVTLPTHLRTGEWGHTPQWGITVIIGQAIPCVLYSPQPMVTYIFPAVAGLQGAATWSHSEAKPLYLLCCSVRSVGVREVCILCCLCGIY